MYSIVKTCFPNATIVIDCFHIVQRLCKALNISDQRTSYKNARRVYLILVKMKKKGGRLVRLTKSYMLSCLDFWLHFLLYGYKRDFEFFRPVWSEILIQ